MLFRGRVAGIRIIIELWIPLMPFEWKRVVIGEEMKTIAVSREFVEL